MNKNENAVEKLDYKPPIAKKDRVPRLWIHDYKPPKSRRRLEDTEKFRG
jgi:hypothetical protein